MNRKLLNRAVVFLLSAMLFSACATQVSAPYNRDETVDFGAYRTWTWVGDHPMVIDTKTHAFSEGFEERIKQNITDELAAKGYNFVTDSQSANFAVAFTVGKRDEIDVTDFPAPYSALQSLGYVKVTPYLSSTLSMDIFDVETRRQVWHGWSTQEIDLVPEAAANVETTLVAVKEILGNFPQP